MATLNPLALPILFAMELCWEQSTSVTETFVSITLLRSSASESRVAREASLCKERVISSSTFKQWSVLAWKWTSAVKKYPQICCSRIVGLFSTVSSERNKIYDAVSLQFLLKSVLFNAGTLYPCNRYESKFKSNSASLATWSICTSSAPWFFLRCQRKLIVF